MPVAVPSAAAARAHATGDARRCPVAPPLLGCQALENMAVMTHIEQQAIKASGLSRENVAAAWDFMIFPVPKADKRKSSADEETN